MRIFFITGVAVLLFASITGSKFLVSLYALELGQNALGIGVLIALYALFPVLLSVVAGKWCDRFGVRRPLIFGSLGTAAGLALPGLMQHSAALYVSAALVGMSFVFFNVAMQNLVPTVPGKGQQLADAEQRTRNVSNFSLGISFAQFLGPMTVGFSTDHFGYSITYGVLALLALVPGVVMFSFPKIIPRRTRRGNLDNKTSVFELFKDAPLRRTFITSGVIIAGVDLFTFYMPIYGRSVGLSASVLGLILGAYAVAQIGVRFFMSSLVTRIGDENVLTYSMVAAAVTYLSFPFFHDAWLLAGAAFVLGLGLGLGQPLSMMMTYNRAPRGRSGEALGVRFSVVNLAHMVIPVLFGSVATAFGVIPVFVGNALFLGAGGYVNSRAPKSPDR